MEEKHSLLDKKLLNADC